MALLASMGPLGREASLDFSAGVGAAHCGKWVICHNNPFHSKRGSRRLGKWELMFGRKEGEHSGRETWVPGHVGACQSCPHPLLVIGISLEQRSAGLRQGAGLLPGDSATSAVPRALLRPAGSGQLGGVLWGRKSCFSRSGGRDAFFNGCRVSPHTVLGAVRSGSGDLRVAQG